MPTYLHQTPQDQTPQDQRPQDQFKMSKPSVLQCVTPDDIKHDNIALSRRVHPPPLTTNNIIPNKLPLSSFRAGQDNCRVSCTNLYGQLQPFLEWVAGM